MPGARSLTQSITPLAALLAVCTILFVMAYAAPFGSTPMTMVLSFSKW